MVSSNDSTMEFKGMKVEIPSQAATVSPKIKVEIPEGWQHKRTESQPPPLPLGPLRADNNPESCPILIPVSEMCPTETAPCKIDYSISQPYATSYAPHLENKCEQKDVEYWERQAVESRRQNLALQVRCQLVEKAFSNAKNMISNLILMYQGSESSEPELILELGMKLRVAPDMGNLSVVQDLLRKTNAIAEKILLYNFELQKNLNDIKEDNQQLRRANEALKKGQYSSSENRVASFEVSPRNSSLVNLHERAVSNAFRPKGLSKTPEGIVGAIGVFGGIQTNPEQAILTPSGPATSATILSTAQPTTTSEPPKFTQELIEAASNSPKKAEFSWRALVSSLREEITEANTRVQHLERRIRMMVESKYEMIENFSIELERLRSSRSRPRS